MGSSKRNRESVSNRSRDRKRTAKTNPDASQEKVVEPSELFHETAVLADSEVVRSPSIFVPALEHEVSLATNVATNVEVPDFDIEKLMDYYHNYGVDCLVHSKLYFQGFCSF
jgi:hypothetical protein